MKRKYHQLTQQQRFIIQDLYELGKTFTLIAKELGVHRSTISREIQRNSNQKGGYRALGAQSYMESRRTTSWDRDRKISGALEELITEKLLLGWSPEQISGRLKCEGSTMSISHESIYRWVYNIAPDFKRCLRHKWKRRQNRATKNRKRGLGKRPRKFIDLRTKKANERLETGHWERDLMEGRRSGPSLLVAVDRKSRYTRIDRVYSHNSDEVNKATERLLKKEKKVKTITNDNGVEFGNHEKLSKQLRVPVYFCHAYTSWERGTVENTIGLIRHFYPKKTDLWQVTGEDIQALQNNLNLRPRKTQGYKTPEEIHFTKKLKLIKSESTYKKQQRKRLIEEEINFWRNFYQEELRALRC